MNEASARLPYPGVDPAVSVALSVLVTLALPCWASSPGIRLPAVTDFISPLFYDLFHENGHVPEIRKKLPPLLAGVRRSILEIGAGTGLITTSLADWTPAEIFALEPSAGMRGVLLSRLGSRPELLKRVTVLSCDALSVELDEPVEAVVMINVMYALEPEYRKRLWPALAARLEPAGLLVFTWRDGGPPKPHPLQELNSRQVGRHTYTVLSEILESDEEACHARYVHRITMGDKVISEEEIIGHAYRPVWDVIQRELVSAGFSQADAAEGLLAWRLA
jgi:SAM-dependent methyltransferase